MNWEVIFLDGKEGRPYRECKICRALKDRGLIEEVEPVAVFVPEGKKSEVLQKIKSIPPKDFGKLLRELYRSWGVVNSIRRIKELFVNTCETCIFHCEKRNSIWLEESKSNSWRENLYESFIGRLKQIINSNRSFLYFVFPTVSFPKILSSEQAYEEVNFNKSIFLGSADFSGIRFGVAYFIGAKFKTVNFEEAKFETAYFQESEFENGDFSGAKFGNADFSRAKFGNAFFVKTEFENVDFCNVKFRNAEFYNIKFEVADFSDSKFEKKLNFTLANGCFSFDFSSISFKSGCKVSIKNLRSNFLFLNNLEEIPDNFSIYNLAILPYKVRAKENIIKTGKLSISWIQRLIRLRGFENRANLEIVSSNLNQAKFVNCDFSGAERIKIENSDLTDVRFLATDWGDINEKRICPELFEKEPKKARDVYRQLKLTLDNHKDFVSANGFYALEMKAQEKILEQSMGIYEKGEGILNEFKSFLRLIKNFGRLPKSKYELLVLKIHRISSNFGQSWVRPFVGLYFLSLIFSLCFHFDEWSNLIKVNYLNFADSSLKVMDFVIGLKVFCCKLLTAFSIPLQMVAEITKVVKGEFKDSNPIVVASRLFYTVVAGFLIYQFGGAVRRRVKR